MITRRATAVGLGLMTLFQPFARARAAIGWTSALAPQLRMIERGTGGRLGVAVIDIASGETADYRGSELFPMCSTFKLLAVAAILRQVDDGKAQLSRRIAVTAADLLSYAPETKTHVGGDMTVAALCQAAITWSDNTAANLLLRELGGPAGVTAFARSLGDMVTRLDRTEPTLNEAVPGDPRDTTTPSAMAANLKLLALGTGLSAGSRAQLVEWLVGCKTGDARLRAGLPRAWKVGDKTGSGERGTANDAAILWPDAGQPIVITAYLTGTTGDDKARDAALASVGRLVASAAQG